MRLTNQIVILFIFYKICSELQFDIDMTIQLYIIYIYKISLNYMSPTLCRQRSMKAGVPHLSVKREPQGKCTWDTLIG